jgi:hypothetical protein
LLVTDSDMRFLGSAGDIKATPQATFGALDHGFR